MGRDHKIDYLSTIRFAFYISVVAVVVPVIIDGFRGYTNLATSFALLFGSMIVLGLIADLICKYILKPEWFEPMNKQKEE